MRIDQPIATPLQQVSGTKTLHKALSLQGSGNQRILTWLICTLTALVVLSTRLHPAFGIQQQNILIHRVFAAIGAQALRDRCLIAIQPRQETAQHGISRQKPHIGSALVKITHQRIQQVLRLAGLSCRNARHRLCNHGLHQVLLQPLEAATRGGHHGQQGLRLLWAIHLGGGLYEPPHQVQLTQRALAAPHLAHMRDEDVCL